MSNLVVSGKDVNLRLINDVQAIATTAKRLLMAKSQLNLVD